MRAPPQVCDWLTLRDTIQGQLYGIASLPPTTFLLVSVGLIAGLPHFGDAISKQIRNSLCFVLSALLTRTKILLCGYVLFLLSIYCLHFRLERQHK